MWHSAVSADVRIEELRQQGAQALAWGLQHDDMLEGLLRQLAAAREFKLTGDSQAAARVGGFRVPGDSVVPKWLQGEARARSQALYKQQLRARAGKGKGRGTD
eukprot:4998169-Lingulodinium_polyedra.AAC.1